MRRIFNLAFCFPAFALLVSACSNESSADSLEGVGQPSPENPSYHPGVKIKLQVPGARSHVEIVEMPDGGLRYLLHRDSGKGDLLVTPDEITKLIHQHQTNRGWLHQILNITGPAGVAWVLIGLGGQLLFTGRMLVQWITSERSQRSVVPVSFWWMSLAGATMLMVYFTWRQDIVGILGQATGWVIYIRNLRLIYRSKGG